MLKLHELKVRIESIPEKRRRKNLVGKLQQYNQMTTQAREVVTACSRGQRYAKLVFPDGDFQRIAEQTRKAANVARRLRKKIAENMDAIETKASNDQFISIGDSARFAHATLKDRWGQLIVRKVADFENLVKAARGANLEGNLSMVEIMRRLSESAGTPPTNEQAAQRIVADINRLDESVSTLGLKGRAGQFLVDAAAGRGNPQDLLAPEVKEFIEQYELWGLLTVRLG